MRFSAALLAAATFGVAVGCLVDLAPQRDCGDGYVDELAGEECEPAQADSLAGRCPVGEIPGPGACDPKTCVFDLAACTRCGNGVLDPGEPCDPKDMVQPTCPLGGAAHCRSDCTVDLSSCGCGDGVIDENLGEECEAALVVGDVAIECTTLPAPSTRAYGSGLATRCVGCKWSRENCRYCGNHKLEDSDVVAVEHLTIDGVTAYAAEVCDHDGAKPIADRTALHEHCRRADLCGGFVDVECEYTCVKCEAFGPPANHTLDCCTAAGAQCPYDPEGMPVEGREACCYEKAHPDQTGIDACGFDQLGHFVCL